MAQRLDDAMTDVIVQLKAITEHFQQSGFEATAINFSRHVRELTEEFNEIMWNVKGDAIYLKTPSSKSKNNQKKFQERVHNVAPVTVPAAVTEPAPAAVSYNLMDLGVDIVPPVPALQPRQQAELQHQRRLQTPKKEQAREARNPPAFQRPIAPEWRQIRALENQSRILNPLNVGISHQQPIAPPVQEKTSIVQQQRKVSPRSPSPPESDNDTESPVVPTKPAAFEPKRKAGVIRLSGPFESAQINDITTQINVGPIYDIVFHRSIGFAEICFLHIEHAEEFIKRDNAHRQEKGFSMLGPGYEVEKFEENDWTNEHADMYEFKERRRLTFAGAGLLTKVTEDKFMRDILAVADEEKVDFIWPFNSGNITAVFGSVSVAKQVLIHFHQLSRKISSPYFKVQVDYSSDPCEKPLPLLTRYTTNRPGNVIYYNKKPAQLSRFQINRPKGVVKRTRLPLKAA